MEKESGESNVSTNTLPRKQPALAELFTADINQEVQQGTGETILILEEN